MTKNLLMVLGFIFSSAFGVCSMQKSTPHSGLELIVNYSFLRLDKDGQEATYRGTAYLRNVSTETVFVVTGPILGPMVSPGRIRYVAKTEEIGEWNSKPSPGSLDLVELHPGGITSLKWSSISIKRGIDQEIEIRYEIDKSIGAFYPIAWIGLLTIQVDTK